MVDFAACLMNRCDISSDGKTLLQRLHGRKANTPILELREKNLLYMPAKLSQAGRKQWNRDVNLGVFVGDARHVSVRRQWLLSPESKCWRSRHAQRTSRNASGSMVSGWQWQCIRHSSRNGEARGDGGSLPWKSADGEQKQRGPTFAERTSNGGGAGT